MEFKLDHIVEPGSEIDEEVLSEESFLETIKKTILVSSKNTFLYSKLQNPIDNNEKLLDDDRMDQSNFSVVSNESFESLHQQYQATVDPFFIISQTFLKKILPFPPRIETKLKTSKLDPESLFELGKQQVYLNLNHEAFNTFEKASFYLENEKFVLWKTGLMARFPKLMVDEKLNCCNKRKIKKPESKFKSILNILKKLPQSIEANWLLMDLAYCSIVKIEKYIEPWQYYASQILKIDKFYGYLAFGILYLKINSTYGLEILHKLAENYPSHPYPYIVLWEFYYNKKEFHKSFDVIAQCFLRVNDCKYSIFFNLILIMYIKSLFKIKNYYTALELIQKKYEESQNDLFYLYLFGKFSVKSRARKMLPASMSALKEVLRWIKNYTKINYWYGKVCYKSGKIYKAQKHFYKVSLSLNRNQVKYSIKIQGMLAKIEKVVNELTIFRNKLETEKVEIVFKDEKNKYHDILKIAHAEFLIKQKKLNEALKILRKVTNFDSFLLIFEKITINLPHADQKKVLVQKIENLFRSKKIPLYEFIESCILYCEFLIKSSQLEEALMILQRIINFYPNFPYNLPYVKYCKDFWISITLLGYKNLMGLTSVNKKDLVMKAVRESLRDGFGEIESFVKGKKKSLSLRDRFLNTNEACANNREGNGQVVENYGVYTDAGVLLKIAEVLAKMKDRSFESKEALQDFLVICRKPIDKIRTLENLEFLK